MSTSQNNYALSQAKFIVLDNCVNNATACSPADRMAADLYAWSAYLHPTSANTPPLLPSAPGVDAKGSIEKMGDSFQVTASWAERVDNAFVERTYSVRVIP